MSEPALRIVGLQKSFGAVRVLRGLNLDAHRGEVHALLGENGAGKSTAMKILAGVTPPDAGQIILDGEAIRLGSIRSALRVGIRTVFQELSTIPNLTVAENLLYGDEETALGLVRRRRRVAAARALLERFGLDRVDPSAPVESLGLGDRQLLEVIKALRETPQVLILDEATSALSAADSQWVLDHGRSAADAGAIVFLITHRLAEVRASADRITVLRSGENVLGGDPAELEDDTLISAMLGRRVERLYPPTSMPKARTAITVTGLRARGLAGPIDLTVSAGEILGIGGLQGQGQRELLLALGGGRRWQAGTATIGERRYQPKSPADALAAGVGYVPEDRQREGLFLGHSVRNNITAASLERYTRRGVLDRRREDAAARAGAARVGVDGKRLSQPVQAMSGGNQQKVVLAKAVITDPQVLLLHDCTRGVDVGTKAEIFSLMATIAAAGTAILFYSSDLTELVHMCARVAVVVEGRIRGVLDRDTLSEDAILRIAVGHRLVDPERRALHEREVMA